MAAGLPAGDNDRPGGRLPNVICQEYGSGPPAPVNVVEYGAETVPAGSAPEAGVMLRASASSAMPARVTSMNRMHAGIMTL